MFGQNATCCDTFFAQSRQHVCALLSINASDGEVTLVVSDYGRWATEEAWPRDDTPARGTCSSTIGEPRVLYPTQNAANSSISET